MKASKLSGVRAARVSDFAETYRDICHKHDLTPVKAVFAFAQDDILDINGDKLSVEDWKPVIESLELKNSLKFIGIRSYWKADKDDDRPKSSSLRLPQVTNGLLASLGATLRHTTHLRCLELQNLSLDLKTVQKLSECLSCNHTLQHLSLQQCSLMDCGLQALCKKLKRCLNVTSVNLIDCGITWRGVHCLTDLVKHQSLLRGSQAWHDSLRDETAAVERAGGVCRLSLNNNTLIGDRGAYILAETLKEDVWLRAVDIQNCGVQDSGARAFLRSLKCNSTLYILDIRRNFITEADVLTRIAQQLSFNVQGQSSQYKWLPLPLAAEKAGPNSGSKSWKKKGIPWRVNSRLGLSRCLPPKQIPGIANIFLQSRPSVVSDGDTTPPSRVSTVRRSNRRSSSSTILKNGKCDTLITIETEFKQLQSLLLAERKLRLAAEAKVEELTSENEKLRRELNSSMDDQTLATIEETFANFNQFIEMLQLVGHDVEDSAQQLKSMPFGHQ